MRIYQNPVIMSIPVSFMKLLNRKFQSMGQTHSIEGLPKDTGINEGDTEVVVPPTQVERTSIIGDGDDQVCESFYNNGELFVSSP